MSTKKQVTVSKRKLLLSLLSIALICIISTGSLVYVAAQSGLTTLTISGGTTSGAPTYTIWTEGGTTYAKDAYGAIESRGTSQTVIQYAITATGNFGSIYLKTGIYDISGLNFYNTATVTDATQQMITFYGDGNGQTILRGITTSTGASSHDGSFTEKAWIMIDSYDVQGIRVYLHDFAIDGQKDSNTNVVEGIALRYGRSANIERVFIHDVWRFGINVVGPNLGFHEVNVRDNIIYNVKAFVNASLPIEQKCVAIKSSFADLYVTGNTIGWIGDDGDTTWSGVGIVLEDSDIATHNIIWAVGDGIMTLGGISSPQIQSNWIDFTYRTGIYLNNCTRAQVSENYIRIPYDYGIYIENSANNTINNNKITNQETFSSVTFIAENGAASNFNSIINNDLTHAGAVTGPIVYILGSHTLVVNNIGFKTETTLLSGNFSITSIAVVSVSVPTGLYSTALVSVKDVSVTVVESTGVDDWAYGYVKVVSIDSTNVVCKVNVVSASGTGGATAKLAITIHNPYSG